MRRIDVRSIPLRAFLDLRYAAGGSPLTQILSQRIGAVLAWAACRAGLSPSNVTCCGIVTFLAGALLYASLPEGFVATACCLIVFHLGYGLDCADGQLARATAATSRRGAWLDVACDYVRHVFLALALAQHLIFRGFGSATSLIISGFLLSGTIVKLHTVSVMRDPASTSASGKHAESSTPRSLGKVALDTATHLTAFALLRDFEVLLGCYAIVVGAAYGSLAYAQVWQRLR